LGSIQAHSGVAFHYIDVHEKNMTFLTFLSFLMRR
jgi:hypothetical protein